MGREETAGNCAALLAAIRRRSPMRRFDVSALRPANCRGECCSLGAPRRNPLAEPRASARNPTISRLRTARKDQLRRRATHSEISAVVCRRRSAGAFRFGFSIIGQSRHNLWCEHQAAEWRPGSRHERARTVDLRYSSVVAQEISANSFLAGTPGLWANLFRWFTRESVGFADAGRQNRCLPSME